MLLSIPAHSEALVQLPVLKDSSGMALIVLPLTTRTLSFPPASLDTPGTTALTVVFLKASQAASRATSGTVNSVLTMDLRPLSSHACPVTIGTVRFALS
jgi:hypothetical protein